jgi:hypothetical protein
MIVGILAGLCAHQARTAMERDIPRIDGVFPLSCYFVGGLVVCLVHGLRHGWRAMFELFSTFAAVGVGTGAGWLFDEWRGKG